jgi:tetratricopeptide (TPR) repeat protein
MTLSSIDPAAPRQRSSVWMYGRSADLLLGSGLGYLLTVPFVAPIFLDPSGTSLLVLTLFVTLVIAGPHYGATLLRVYEARESRRRYALFAVHFTLALIGVTWLGSRVPLVGSLLLTLYVTWSPWHFAGQNYGVTLMQLRRQGLEIEPFEKRLLYLSYLLSFLLVLVVTHMGPSSAVFAPGGLRTVVPEGRGRELLEVYHVLRLGIPAGAAGVLVPVLLAGYVGTTGRVLARFVSRAGWSAVAPGAAVLSTQALWFSVPALLQFFGVNASASLVFSALWISAFHSLQYLWVTSYYAKRSDAGFRWPAYLAKATLGGAALNAVPVWLLAPGVLGRVPFDSGLALLVFSVLNLHHFVLDGAIWKLRDGQVARALLRDEPPQGPEPVRPARSWLRGPVFAIGALGAVAMLASEAETRIFEGAVRGPELGRAEQALRRLHWLGRDSAWNYVLLAARHADLGQRAEAAAALEQSLAIQPSSEAWLRRGALHELAGDGAAALAAYERALALDPDDPRALERRAQVQRRAGG